MITKFQDLNNATIVDVESALLRNDLNELKFVAITVALVFPDQLFAQKICVRLCAHENREVRGNAVMSLGHLARRFRRLDEVIVRGIIESALRDDDENIRTLAKSAADEIHQFLHWEILGHCYE